ncbi:unnamed protein product, partial [Notodromas monacha]
HGNSFEFSTIIDNYFPEVDHHHHPQKTIDIEAVFSDDPSESSFLVYQISRQFYDSICSHSNHLSVGVPH